MKVIFIPVSDRPECVLALHQGFTIAQQQKSNVIGCHIRPHSDSSVSLPFESSESIITLDSYDLAWEAVLKESSVDEGHIKAKVLFEKMAHEYDYELLKKPKDKVCAMWAEKVGSPDRLFAISGPVTDLIVVSRPMKMGKSMAKTIMISAVLSSSSPVLVLPQKANGDLGKRICIAWNQSAEAALAVKAALPLLQRAEEITVLTCGPEDQLGPKANQLVNYLNNWQVNASSLKVKGSNDVQAILNGYAQSESDLLVMGGYSRSRLRQRVFGGVTEYMLNNADIPVFIMHT